MCLLVSYKKLKKIFFVFFKSLIKGVGSVVGSGSGSTSLRCGSGEPNPHPKCHESPNTAVDLVL
jgi:hypothetical protein